MRKSLFIHCRIVAGITLLQQSQVWFIVIFLVIFVCILFSRYQHYCTFMCC